MEPLSLLAWGLGRAEMSREDYEQRRESADELHWSTTTFSMKKGGDDIACGIVTLCRTQSDNSVMTSREGSFLSVAQIWQMVFPVENAKLFCTSEIQMKSKWGQLHKSNSVFSLVSFFKEIQWYRLSQTMRYWNCIHFSYLFPIYHCHLIGQGIFILTVTNCKSFKV